MMTIDKETMGSSSSNGLSPNVLKRKNEDCVDLEAEINGLLWMMKRLTMKEIPNPN